MTDIAWYTSSSICAIRFNMCRSFLLLRSLLQHRCCAAITRSSGRVLARRMLASVGWGSPDTRQLCVLAAGLAAATAACAAAGAACAAAIAAAVAADASALAPQVHLVGTPDDGGVGVRCRSRSRIVAVPRNVGVGVGVRTLRDGRVSIAGRSGVSSSL